MVGSIEVVRWLRIVPGCLLVVACGDAKPAGVSPTACAEAATHSVDAMLAQARGRRAGSGQGLDDARPRISEGVARLETLAPRLEALLTNRCVEDAWSAAAVACFARATSYEAVRACRAELSPDQQSRLTRAELDLTTEQPGLPGFGASAPPPPPLDPRLEQLRHRVNDALKEVASATTDAERAAARARLEVLLAERARIERQLATARVTAIVPGVTPSPAPVAGPSGPSGSGPAATGSAANGTGVSGPSGSGPEASGSGAIGPSGSGPGASGSAASGTGSSGSAATVPR